MTTDQKWRKTLAWLRRNFPTRLLCSVRRVHGLKRRDRSQADVTESGGRFLIRVARDQSWDSQMDGLLHEWAHALTWHGNDTDDHGEEWALAYGRIYRLHCEWNYGRGARAS